MIGSRFAALFLMLVAVVPSQGAYAVRQSNDVKIAKARKVIAQLEAEMNALLAGESSDAALADDEDTPAEQARLLKRQIAGYKGYITKLQKGGTAKTPRRSRSRVAGVTPTRAEAELPTGGVRSSGLSVTSEDVLVPLVHKKNYLSSLKFDGVNPAIKARAEMVRVAALKAVEKMVEKSTLIWGKAKEHKKAVIGALSLVVTATVYHLFFPDLISFDFLTALNLDVMSYFSFLNVPMSYVTGFMARIGSFIPSVPNFSSIPNWFA